MGFITGLLTLGTGLSGAAVVAPPSGAGYFPQQVSYDLVSGGIALNTVNAVFGPVSGTWGTLCVWGVTDESSNPVWAGTLQTPFTPPPGYQVIVPTASLMLNTGQQYPVNGSGIFALPAGVFTPSG